MQYVGDRISLLEKENELSIVILSYKHPVKNFVILAWLILFSICGVMAINELIHAKEPDRRVFWMVFTGFWVYFEWMVLKACLWRLRGKEKVLLTKEALRIKREITGLESYREYRLDQVENWKMVIPDVKSITGSYENAYWFIGAERISFDYKGKEIRWACQLNKEDAGLLLGKIKHWIR